MNAPEMQTAITYGLFDEGNTVVLHLSNSMSTNGTVSHLVRDTDGPTGVVLAVTVWPEGEDPVAEMHSLFVPKSSIIAVDTITSSAQ